MTVASRDMKPELRECSTSNRIHCIIKTRSAGNSMPSGRRTVLYRHSQRQNRAVLTAFLFATVGAILPPAVSQGVTEEPTRRQVVVPATIELAEPVHWIAFNKDSSRLLIAGAQSITAWDLNGNRTNKLPRPTRLKNRPCIYSDHGPYFTKLNDDDADQIVDASTGSIVSAWAGPQFLRDGSLRTSARVIAGVPSYSIAISPDPRLAAIGGYLRLIPLRNAGPADADIHLRKPSGNHIITFDSANGEIVQDIQCDEPVSLEESAKGARARSFRFEFSPDGRRIAAAFSDGELAMWNASDGKLLRKFAAEPVTAEAWRDGTLSWVSGCDQIIMPMTASAKKDQRRRTFPRFNISSGVVDSAEWPAPSLLPIRVRAKGQEAEIRSRPVGYLCYGFSPDGNLAICVEPYPPAETIGPARLEIADVRREMLLGTVAISRNARPTQILFAPDSSRVAIALHAGSVFVLGVDELRKLADSNGTLGELHPDDLIDGEIGRLSDDATRERIKKGEQSGVPASHPVTASRAVAKPDPPFESLEVGFNPEIPPIIERFQFSPDGRGILVCGRRASEYFISSISLESRSVVGKWIQAKPFTVSTSGGSFVVGSIEDGTGQVFVTGQKGTAGRCIRRKWSRTDPSEKEFAASRVSDVSSNGRFFACVGTTFQDNVSKLFRERWLRDHCDPTKPWPVVFSEFAITDVRTGDLVRLLEVPKLSPPGGGKWTNANSIRDTSIASLWFSADGHHVVAQSSSTILAWELSTWKLEAWRKVEASPLLGLDYKATAGDYFPRASGEVLFSHSRLERGQAIFSFWDFLLGAKQEVSWKFREPPATLDYTGEIDWLSDTMVTRGSVPALLSPDLGLITFLRPDTAASFGTALCVARLPQGGDQVALDLGWRASSDERLGAFSLDSSQFAALDGDLRIRVYKVSDLF